MNTIMKVVLFPIIAVLAQQTIALAQNPCSEIGPGCREMTAKEVKAFKERLLAVKALLPVPDPARYEHDGMAEGGTMPFIAEAGFPGATLICRSWPAGCFPENPYNTLDFGYLRKEDNAKASEKPKNFIDATMIVSTLYENKIEVSAWLLPHPYLLEEFRLDDAVNVEKSAAFLSWESGEDNIDFHMIFGPRTSSEEETLIQEKTVQNFAPVTSIEIMISGPKAEVTTLKKNLNRQAFEALLGSVLK